MTTTNNHLLLIEQVGGVEKARVIVEGAPETSQFWRDMDSICSPNEILYYVEGPLFWIVWDVEKQKWVESIISEGSEYIIEQLQSLDELRTAIEHYYYGRSEAEELAAYAELSHEKIEGGAMLVGDFSEARKKVDQLLLGNSEGFKAYVVSKFPNRSPKTLFQQERINHSEYKFMVPEVQLMSEVWQLRQAEIDRLEEWNLNQARSIKAYQGEDEDLKALLQKLIDDEYTTMRPSMAYEIQKALRGES